MTLRSWPSTQFCSWTQRRTLSMGVISLPPPLASQLSVKYGRRDNRHASQTTLPHYHHPALSSSRVSVMLVQPPPPPPDIPLAHHTPLHPTRYTLRGTLGYPEQSLALKLANYERRSPCLLTLKFLPTRWVALFSAGQSLEDARWCSVDGLHVACRALCYRWVNHSRRGLIHRWSLSWQWKAKWWYREAILSTRLKNIRPHENFQVCTSSLSSSSAVLEDLIEEIEEEFVIMQ